MNISIHDTHRLPYFNATITAKQLNDSTTPVEFHTFAHNGESIVIGTTIKTNARGYLCQSDGTPYVDGVFVDEDAIVTASLPDGSSTSWTVGAESEIGVFDGILFGRLITDPNEYSENDYIIGTVHYKRLFSANQENDSPLSLWDLQDVPNFYKWKETQQIERIDLSNVNHSATIVMGIQTKILVIQNSAANNAGPSSPFTVYLQASLDIGEDGYCTRFGRSFTIYNQTDYQIILRNKAAEWNQMMIATLNRGSALQIGETYPNAQPNNDVDGGPALFVPADNGELAIFENFVIGGENKIAINDQTSPVIHITDVTSKTMEVVKEITVTSNCSRSRRIILVRGDSYDNTLLIKDSGGNRWGYLPKGGACELWVGSNNFVRVVDDNRSLPRNQVITLGTNNTTTYPIHPGTGSVTIDATAAKAADFSNPKNYKLKFSVNDTGCCRIEITKNTVPVWFQLVADSGLEGEMFCVPASGGRVCVRNTCGVLQVIERSWKPWNPNPTKDGDSTWNAKCTAFDVKLDIGEINALGGGIWGYSHSGPTNDLNIWLPLNDGQTAFVRFNVKQYSAADDYEGKDPHINICGPDGVELVSNIESSIFTGWYDWQDEQNNILLSSQLVTCKIARSGNTATVSEITRIQKGFE